MLKIIKLPYMLVFKRNNSNMPVFKANYSNNKVVRFSYNSNSKKPTKKLKKLIKLSEF